MPLRTFLLREARRFVHGAPRIPGVVRIAMIGSLLTDKQRQKDIDLLVTIDRNVGMNALAAAGRRVKGKGQSQGSGADIFLCNADGTYLGRTCSYRECHPRVACAGYQCTRGTRVCDDFKSVELARSLILTPPLVLWPEVVRGQAIPEDVERHLLR